MSAFPIANRRPSDRCPGFITDLILRCAAGEDAALGSLFDHLYPVVLAIVRSSAPPPATDDLVLATFRRVWDRSPTFDPRLRESVEWTVSQAEAVLAQFSLGAGPHRCEAQLPSASRTVTAAPLMVSPR